MEEEKPLGCEHQDLYCLVLGFYQYMQGLQAEPGFADHLILYFFLYMQDLQAEPRLADLLIFNFFSVHARPSG